MVPVGKKLSRFTYTAIWLSYSSANVSTSAAPASPALLRCSGECYVSLVKRKSTAMTTTMMLMTMPAMDR